MGLGNNLIGDIEELLATNVLRSRELFRFSNISGYCSKFENELSKMYHGYHALMLPSASLGLFTILKALKLPKGSEILIPPFSWKSNYGVLCLEGYKIRFVNITPTLAIDRSSLKRCISQKTKAIIIPHLIGRAQHCVLEVSSFCEKNGINLIEDISQAFGVNIAGKMVGTFGDASYCSMNQNKHLSSGDGGFVLVRDYRLYERIMCYHDQGCLIKNSRRMVPFQSDWGYSLRVSNLTGAIAYAQIIKFNMIKTKIIKAYENINAILKKYDIEELIPGEGDIPFFFLFRHKGRKHLDLPTLYEAGWHSIHNIEKLKPAIRRHVYMDNRFMSNFSYLSKIYSIGSGLVDKYYSTPYGVNIDYSQEDVSTLTNLLDRLL